MDTKIPTIKQELNHRFSLSYNETKNKEGTCKMYLAKKEKLGLDKTYAETTIQNMPHYS